MSKHNKGRLHLAGRETRGLPHSLVASKTLLFRVYSEAFGDIEEETDNARRLVACWNLCDGISTKNLETNLPVRVLAQRYNAVLKDRDALRAALVRMHKVCMAMDLEADRQRPTEEEYQTATAQAAQAIASTEGGAV